MGRDISPSVEDAKDEHRIGLDLKGYRDTTIKAYDPQAGSNVIASGAAFGKPLQTITPALDSFNIVQCALGATVLRYVVVQFEKIRLGFWREEDFVSPLHAVFLLRSAWRARTALKTSFAFFARLGSDWIAS